MNKMQHKVEEEGSPIVLDKQKITTESCPSVVPYKQQNPSSDSCPHQAPTTRTSSNRQWVITIGLAACLLILDVIYYYDNMSTDADSPYPGTLRQLSPRQEQGGYPRRRLIETSASVTAAQQQHHIEFDENDPHLALFQLSDYTVLGPTQFPKPTDLIRQQLQDALQPIKGHPTVEVTPRLKPVLGQHRSDQDAVFVFASEYDLSIYQGFILSLRKTGFQGDIVLAVSPLDMAEHPGSSSSSDKESHRQQMLHEFFASDPHDIIYVVPFVCYNAEGMTTDSAKGGMRVCHCHVLYQTRNVTEGNDILHIEYSAGEWKPLADVRESRPVATTRYELYWIWSIQYQPHTWQMLVDARDTYFQTDPFAAVPREPIDNKPTSKQRQDGVLFFFGENADATRIGKSDKNRKWLTNAYGTRVIQAMQDKPTICSGATMGEQIALETYLRAMVNEFDETEIKLMVRVVLTTGF